MKNPEYGVKMLPKKGIQPEGYYPYTIFPNLLCHQDSLANLPFNPFIWVRSSSRWASRMRPIGSPRPSASRSSPTRASGMPVSRAILIWRTNSACSTE